MTRIAMSDVVLNRNAWSIVSDTIRFIEMTQGKGSAKTATIAFDGSLLVDVSDQHEEIIIAPVSKNDWHIRSETIH